MIRDRPAFRIKPEILKTSEIQNRAEQLTLAYADQVGLDAARLGISFQVVYEELIYPDYGIEFLVPLPVVEEVVERIKDGSISDYVLDMETASMKRRGNAS